MKNLILLQVVNDYMELNLLEGDEVTVDITQEPRGNGRELGVFKMNGEYFISKYTKFGFQILFLLDSGIKTVYSSSVEVIGTVVSKEIEMNIKKAPAATGALNVTSIA